MQKQNLIVLIGIPGCGKSTFADHARNEAGMTVISTDEIREELTGEAGSQERNKDVFPLAYGRTRRALEEGKDVVFDATNVTRSSRKQVLSCIPDRNSIRVTYVWFDVPLAKCIQRNRTRDRQVPEPVIKRFSSHFETPLIGGEDFDRIVVSFSGGDDAWFKAQAAHCFKD